MPGTELAWRGAGRRRTPGGRGPVPGAPAVKRTAPPPRRDFLDDRTLFRERETDGYDDVGGASPHHSGDYQGYIRWDRNEGSWADLLNGNKEIAWENVRDAERLDRGRERGRDRESSIEILGLRISWDDDEDYPTSASSGIRFGHIQRLMVYGDDRAVLELKSGEEIELEGGSTDIGDELRELIVDDPDRGRVSLRWRDLDEVEFLPGPGAAIGEGDRRIHGTLTTRRGREFTGFIAWDVDEILGGDVLDGEERGRDHEIPFHRIAAIERAGPDASRVVLANGEELTLRGTNDVDDRNRGISVSDPALGQVTVDWDAFDAVRLHPAAPGTGGYGSFDGGHALWGTVETESGERLTGWIRWDNDEAWSWELLDGEEDDVEYDIEFGQIERIARRGSWGSEVVLRDGRTFELEGSNDVDDGNKGIYLTPDGGETVLVEWWDVREVTFEHP